MTIMPAEGGLTMRKLRNIENTSISLEGCTSYTKTIFLRKTIKSFSKSNVFKRAPAETKDEILSKVKSGMPISEAAKQYAISTKRTYTWLNYEVIPLTSLWEYNRLKKENKEAN